MKVFLFSALLVGVSAAEAKEVDCDFVHGFAKQVMTARQLEMPVTKLMKIANGDKVAEVLIKTAYQQPAFRVKVNQDKEVNRFANQAYLICLEAKGERK